MSVLYDAGALIAAEHGDRELWAEHRARLEMDLLPRTTAPVVAQVSRSPTQAQLRRFLRGCLIDGFEGEQAHEVGSLLAKTGTADVVDAHLVLLAARTGSTVLTSDTSDLERLSKKLPQSVSIRRI